MKELFCLIVALRFQVSIPLKELPKVSISVQVDLRLNQKKNRESYILKYLN